MLDFLLVTGGDLLITPMGTAFTTADIQHSKKIFADQARDRLCGRLAHEPYRGDLARRSPERSRARCSR